MEQKSRADRHGCIGRILLAAVFPPAARRLDKSPSSPALPMGQLFSHGRGARKKEVTEVDRAILALKTQRRKLGEYQKKVEELIAREADVARRLVREGRKDRALLALKKKRLQEDMLQKADVWVLNVEQQLADIEITSKQAAVFASLKAGHDAVRRLQSQIDLADIEKLTEDTEEAKAFQKEIEAALGQELSAADEDAVLLEFENLEAELGADEVPDLPSVPTQPVSVSAPPEEDGKEEAAAEEEAAAAAAARPAKVTEGRLMEEPLAA